jgi:hypothetical protein
MRLPDWWRGHGPRNLFIHLLFQFIHFPTQQIPLKYSFVWQCSYFLGSKTDKYLSFYRTHILAMIGRINKYSNSTNYMVC